MSEIDRGPQQPDGRQRFNGERDRVRVALRSRHARHLDARLQQLALRARPAIETDDRALVTQPHGSALVAVAGGDEAGNLRRDVGAQRDHLARARLDEADGGGARGVAQSERQHLFVLEHGRDDAREAAALEHREQRVHDPTPRRRGVGRVIAHARREAQRR